MSKVSNIVIHRDGTFEYDGEVYKCQHLGPYGSGDDVYEVYRVRDGAVVGGNVGQLFDRLGDIRAYVAESEANGWPLVNEPADATER